MRKSMKYSLIAFFVLIVIFLSLDIQKLDKHNATNTTKEFNAKEYALDIWQKKIPKAIDEAPDIIPLFKMINKDPDKAFEDFGRKLGISKTYYFMVKGEGIIHSMEDEFFYVQIGDSINIQLATAFIFGNAVREGSGVADINEFVNMTDFNNVSVMLNKIVKEEIVADLNKFAKSEMHISFAGTFEINSDNFDINSIRIIPVSVKLQHGEQY
ncbi:DUF2291 domain-containing protein [Bacteroidota bacterium]